jgi:hypothetical protein
MPIGTSCGVSAVRAKQAMETGTSALDKIAALLEFMADGLTNDPPKVRFVLQFDAMYARHRPVERLLWLETRISTQGFESFSALIREGLTDGSPRPDLDPALTMHAVINAVIGTQRRLASLGDRVELEYGKPIDVLFREIIRIILLVCEQPAPRWRPTFADRRSQKERGTRETDSLAHDRHLRHTGDARDDSGSGGATPKSPAGTGRGFELEIHPRRSGRRRDPLV